MKASRRRFLRLIAAGSAAAVTGPAAAVAKPGRPAKKPAEAKPEVKGPAPPAALAEEIRRQKATLDQGLKALRDYPLPPGSEPGFTFVPLKARRKGRPS